MILRGHGYCKKNVSLRHPKKLYKNGVSSLFTAHWSIPIYLCTSRESEFGAFCHIESFNFNFVFTSSVWCRYYLQIKQSHILEFFLDAVMRRIWIRRIFAMQNLLTLFIIQYYLCIFITNSVAYAIWLVITWRIINNLVFFWFYYFQTLLFTSKFTNTSFDITNTS